MYNYVKMILFKNSKMTEKGLKKKCTYSICLDFIDLDCSFRFQTLVNLL